MNLLRSATLRPTAWAELQRRCEDTHQTLRTLQDTQPRLDRAAREWRERLAVAPLLARLDQALARCAELADAPALGEDATASLLRLQGSTEDGLRQVQRAREQDEARRLLALRAAAFGALGPVCAAAGVDTEARRAWDAIDAGDAAAQAHAQMEQSGAAIRSGMVPPPPGSRP